MLVQHLLRFVRERFPDFKFTSIQCNRGYAARQHVDGNNVGPSLTVSLGSFKDGELWVHDLDGDVRMRVVQRMPRWKSRPMR